MKSGFRFLLQPVLVIPIAIGLLAECTSEKSASEFPTDSSAVAPSTTGVHMRLVDMTETEQYDAHKIEVTLEGRVDTIPDVLTFDLPIIASNGLLQGPLYTMDGDYAGIYSYDPRKRVMSKAPLPVDAARWDSEVKLSPDASHIAYIGADSTGSQGIVRTWPGAAVVLKTMSARQPGSDFSSNQVRWVNPDSVEFSWEFDRGPESDPRFQYLVVYSSLPAKRFTVDTLRESRSLRSSPEPNPED